MIYTVSELINYTLDTRYERQARIGFREISEQFKAHFRTCKPMIVSNGALDLKHLLESIL